MEETHEEEHGMEEVMKKSQQDHKHIQLTCQQVLQFQDVKKQTNATYQQDITINAGDTVEWINVDTAAHTVTGGKSSRWTIRRI